ncbi:hypothetical protein SDJN03_27413, partial [Cucurbita argyrosperma subsp. sororia]
MFRRFDYHQKSIGKKEEEEEETMVEAANSEGCSIKIVFDSYIFDPLGSVIGRKTILGKGKIGEGAKGSFQSYVYEEVGNWMGKLMK